MNNKKDKKTIGSIKGVQYLIHKNSRKRKQRNQKTGNYRKRDVRQFLRTKDVNLWFR